jgi:cytochrome c-type biogenesis protein CcmH/NrfG
VQLLIRREPARAAEWAQALIAAEPDDAFGYLCLGAALQDQGRWGEAHQAYAQCVHQAKRGDVTECGALGGRR